jgi:hypothetical protein
MDFSRLTQGERISGIAGIALFLIMIIFKWYGVKIGADGLGSIEGGTRNAFQSFGFIDIILLITAIVAVALPVVSASETEVGLPVALSAVVVGLGALSVLLIVIRIISPPDLASGGVHVSDVPGADVTRKIGVWLGLIAAAGVTYGGWRAMQEEGTSFGGEADRFRSAPGDGPSAGPPPPPPSEAP